MTVEQIGSCGKKESNDPSEMGREGREGGTTSQTTCSGTDPHMAEGCIVPFAGAILGVRQELGGQIRAL